jgi:YfiH family protein
VCYIRGLGDQDFKIVSRSGLKRLENPAFAHPGWLLHAFSTRAGGSSRPPAAGLNLGFTLGEVRARVQKNRNEFLRSLGAQDFDLAEIHQIHSTLVHRVRRAKDGHLQYLPCGYQPPAATRNRAPQGDALITDEPGILLSVRSADCVPILLVDSERRTAAAIHAGWKGMLGGIAEKTAGEMQRQFGSHPGALRAAIGPSIRACCYEVSEDLAAAFCGAFAEGERFVRKPPLNRRGREPYPPPFLSRTPPGHGSDGAPRPHLDLVAAARSQLRRAGLSPSHIHVADFCTACRTDLFFSHRKEGSHAGRMMAVIGIHPRSERRKP